MDEYILTIAIPTYNRRKYLQENLQVLLPQLSDCYEKVELLISDNASEDDTEEYINNLQKKYSISYYRNSQNLGADGNFIECYKKAKGKYLIILSDDDIFLPNSLNKLIHIIKHNPRFIFLNCCGFNGNYSEMHSVGKPTIALDEDKYTNDKDEFMSLVGISITFVSALCYRMDLVKSIKNINQYKKTDFIQSYVAFETIGMSEKESLCISATPFIAARGGNAGGYNFYYTWFEHYYELMIRSISIASIDKKLMKRIIYESYKSTILGFIRIFRLQPNKLELKKKGVVWSVMKRYPALWLKTLFWVYTPKKVLMLLKKIRGHA